MDSRERTSKYAIPELISDMPLPPRLEKMAEKARRRLSTIARRNRISELPSIDIQRFTAFSDTFGIGDDTLGFAFPVRVDGETWYEIRLTNLARYLSADDFDAVIAHELAHVITMRENPKAAKHGPTFEGNVRGLGFKPSREEIQLNFRPFDTYDWYDSLVHNLRITSHGKDEIQNLEHERDAFDWDKRGIAAVVQRELVKFGEAVGMRIVRDRSGSKMTNEPLPSCPTLEANCPLLAKHLGIG